MNLLSIILPKGKTDRKEQFDKAAELLKNDPVLREAFEKSYNDAAKILGEDEAPVKSFRGQGTDAKDTDSLINLEDRITDELITLSDRKSDLLTDKEIGNAVQAAEIYAYPKELRPQLTGHLITVQCSAHSTEDGLMAFIEKYLTTDDTKEKRYMYGHIRYGIDILDIDPPIYELLGRDPNSIEHWFYRIKDAAGKEGFFRIPETKIVQVPLPILQLTRIDYPLLTQTTKDIVNKWCMKAFNLDISKSYFVKTGVFSDKFDFRNQRVSGDEVKCLGEYLLYITNHSVMIESPLNPANVGHYGAATTRTWVVREFIEDKEDNPTIYHGLPLHTEYRFFVDFKEKKLLGVSPYWKKNMMEKRFAEDNDIHDRHDYITYKSHEGVMQKRYDDNIEKVTEHMLKVIENADFTGLPDQWSVDVMQNGDDFYIIDMALADNSALRSCVPEGLLKKQVPELIQAEA